MIYYRSFLLVLILPLFALMVGCGKDELPRMKGAPPSKGDSKTLEVKNGTKKPHFAQ